MSENYAIIIHFMLPLTTFYRSGAHRSDVYKWDAFVTSWRFYNHAWQPQRHDRLPETSGTLWIHRRALTNQRCSLATGCGIIRQRRRIAAHGGGKRRGSAPMTSFLHRWSHPASEGIINKLKVWYWRLCDKIIVPVSLMCCVILGS